MSNTRELRLGTRGSQLALWQAHAVAARVAAAGGPPCRIVVIRTSGDRLQDAPLSEVGGKRLFVKEIEDALLAGEIDAAVHSSKDMPAVLPAGLAIAGVLPREDPLDAVILPAGGGVCGTLHDLVAALGQTPTIGTSSVRRIAQLMRIFPGGRFLPIRGNLDTRLRKLDAGEYDAIVLAAAGLMRLGAGARISARIPVDACVPAPGQGIVAVEIRDGDETVRRAVAGVNDIDAGAALEAERAVVAALGGGCQTPIGALASLVASASDARESGGALELVAVVVSLDGGRAVRAHRQGAPHDAAALGAKVGADLLAEGAGDILAEAQRVQDAPEGLRP